MTAPAPYTPAAPGPAPRSEAPPPPAPAAAATPAPADPAATHGPPAAPTAPAQDTRPEPAGAVDIWVDSAKDTCRRLWDWFGRDTGFGQEHPPCLADLFVYWWAAPMAGENNLLRWVQRIDGFTIGLACTLAGYSFAWLTGRPLRRITFLLILIIVWRLS